MAVLFETVLSVLGPKMKMPDWELPLAVLSEIVMLLEEEMPMPEAELSLAILPEMALPL